MERNTLTLPVAYDTGRVLATTSNRKQFDRKSCTICHYSSCGEMFCALLRRYVFWHRTNSLLCRGPIIKRDLLATTFQCLLFGRETHASTNQSDPLLLPTRNGRCREDGVLPREDLS